MPQEPRKRAHRLCQKSPGKELRESAKRAQEESFATLANRRSPHLSNDEVAIEVDRAAAAMAEASKEKNASSDGGGEVCRWLGEGCVRRRSVVVLLRSSNAVNSWGKKYVLPKVEWE